MEVDWHINMGHVLTLAGMVVGGIWTGVKLAASLKDSIVTQFVEINKQFISINDSFKLMATQNEAVAHTTTKVIEGLSDRMKSLEEDMDKIADATVELARQDERLKSLERRITDVETDVGMLTRPHV